MKLPNLKKRPTNARVLHNGAYAAVLTAAVLAAVILLNLVVQALPTKFTEFDISTGGMFTLSDTTAMAAMKALEDHGRCVPEDCSVIAIDGINVSEYVNPTLTTMVQPVEEMGRESVRILADMIEQRCSSRHLRLEARLRPGGSVRQI